MSDIARVVSNQLDVFKIKVRSTPKEMCTVISSHCRHPISPYVVELSKLHYNQIQSVNQDHCIRIIEMLKNPKMNTAQYVNKKQVDIHI